MPSSSRVPLNRVLAALLVLVVSGLAFSPLSPPAVPAVTSRDEFSARRAWNHVEVVAAAPRVIGSRHHARVRRYIVEQLRRLDLDPHVQPVTVLEHSRDNRVRGARALNVVARLPGRSAQGAVLLVSHYDSVHSSPGAADSAAGVAALLETARALRAGPPPPRDVIFLFTDGEEPGLLGATGFVRDHPWLDDVGLVFNLDARGSRGPSLAFETGRRSQHLLTVLQRSAARPLTFSFSEEVYRRLPNTTDFSVFRPLGLAGLNFAFIHGADSYHTSLDRIAALDPRSLHHHGVQILTLARVASGATARDVARSYFPLPFAGLVIYPSPAWSTFLLLAMGTALLVPVWRHHGGAILASAAGLAVALVAAAVIAAAIHALSFGIAGLSTWQLGDGSEYLLALCLLAGGSSAGLATVLLRRRPLPGLLAGGSLLWLLLAAAAGAWAPGAAYLALWPGLAAAAAALAASRLLRTAPGTEPWLGAFAAAPGLLLWLPALALLAVAMQAEAALVPAVFSALLAVLSTPCLLAVSGAGRTSLLLPAALLVAGAVSLVAALSGAGAGRERPRPDSLLYALDAGTGEAVWASFDAEPDPWTRAFVPPGAARQDLAAFFGPGMIEARTAPAPVIDLAAPVMERLREVPARDGGRVLDLRVRSSRRAAMMRVAFSSAEPFELISVDQRQLGISAPRDGPSRFYLDLIYYGLPAGGFPLRLRSTGRAPITVAVVDRSFELPTQALPELRPRPPDIRPTWAVPTDLVLVRREAML